jgi:hypothetical protein
MESKKRRKIVYWTIAIAAVIVGYHVGWVIFHKPAYHGRVIDAETKRPIEGAVVVAIYEAWALKLLRSDYDVVGVRETLTNKNGEFHISSYNTIIVPWWVRSDTRFVIYKPGYGDYPRHYVSPPSLSLDQGEQFFLGELGTPGEFERLSKKIKVTYGVVELPKLKTREERLRSISGTLTDFGSKELPLSHEAINEEYKKFGLSEVK